MTAAAVPLCAVCHSVFIGAGDDPSTGKPRCNCTGPGPSPLLVDLVFRGADGREHRQRSGYVDPPPGCPPPFVLTWTGTRCERCGAWRTDHDDTRTRVHLWGPGAPNMAPVGLCSCGAARADGAA